MAGEFLVRQRGNTLDIDALSEFLTPGEVIPTSVPLMRLVNHSKPPVDSLSLEFTNSGQAVLLEGLAPRILDIHGMRQVVADFFGGTHEVSLSYDIPNAQMHRITPELLSVMPHVIIKAVAEERDSRPRPGQYL